MGPGGTISTVDSNLSLNSLGSRAAAALFLHFTIFVNSRRNAFTGTHVNLKVSFSFAHNTLDFNRNSSDKISRNSASANSWGWFSAFFNASIFRPVNELFWARFKHDFSGREAFSVDISFSLFTSALDAFVFGSGPTVTDLSCFIVLVSAREWDAHTATFTGVSNSDMTHWAITAAFSVANWNEESFHVWSAWARASGTWIAHWTPEGAWLVSFTFELTDIKWNTSPFDVTGATTNNWGINWSSTVWARLKWWLDTAEAFDSILATATDTDVSDSGGDFTVSAWKIVRNWTVSRVADAFVVIAASWSGWVVSGDQDWRTTSVGASSFSWNWATFWSADTLFLVDSGAASAWSFDVNLRSGNHFESGWASGWLIVNWTFRRIATASMLWATFTFSSCQNRADAVTSWGWWAEFWFVDADMVVSRAASVFVTVDINSDWKFFNEASKFGRAVFDDWSSAVFWVADAFELWTAISFSSSFFTVSAGSSDNNSDLFTGKTVSFFVRFFSLSASSSITFTRFTAATRIPRFV